MKLDFKKYMQIYLFYCECMYIRLLLSIWNYTSTVWEVSLGNYLHLGIRLLTWIGMIFSCIPYKVIVISTQRKRKFVYCKWLYKINKLLGFNHKASCQFLLPFLLLRFKACLGKRFLDKKCVFVFFPALFFWDLFS